jgi:hypothetical protein
MATQRSPLLVDRYLYSDASIIGWIQINASEILFFVDSGHPGGAPDRHAGGAPQGLQSSGLHAGSLDPEPGSPTRPLS